MTNNITIPRCLTFTYLNGYYVSIKITEDGNNAEFLPNIKECADVLSDIFWNNMSNGIKLSYSEYLSFDLEPLHIKYNKTTSRLDIQWDKDNIPDSVLLLKKQLGRYLALKVFW